METQNNVTPTPAAEWQGAIQVEGVDLPLPSGNVARVRQISPQAFITSGLIPDPLTGIIRQAIHNKKGLPPTEAKKMIEDPAKLTSALEMFDRVLSYVVVEPKVSMPPTCTECGEYFNNGQHTNAGHPYLEAERQPGILYADVVTMDDKMFIFQWCIGGTSDLEKFREELQANVGSLSDGQGVQRPAKRTTRRK